MLFRSSEKPTLSGDAKVKKPNIPDGSRNGENVTGVDPKKVWRWLQIHRGLFQEAVGIAISKKITAHIQPAELETAYEMFRERISLPKDLKISHDRR